MKRIFIGLLLAWVAVACGHSGDCILLDTADRLMAERPDSALQLLAARPNHTFEVDALRARHAVLYQQAMVKNGIESDLDTLIRIGVDYYETRLDEPDYRARAFYYAGRVYQQGGHLHEAMSCYVEAEYSASMGDDRYMKGLVATALGRLYRKQNYYIQSAERFVEAVDHFEQVGHDRFALQAMVHAAADLFRVGDPVRSKTYGLRAYALAKELQDTTALLYLVRGSAVAILDMGAYRMALDILTEAAEHYTGGVIPRDWYLETGKAYMHLGEIDSAAHYLSLRLVDREEQERCERLLDQSAGHWILENEDAAGEFFAAMGEYKKAYNRKNRAFNTLDSIYRAEKVSLIPSMRGRFRRQMLEEQNKALRLRLSLQWMLAITMLFCFVLFIMWLYARRQSLILLQRNAISEYRNTISRLKDAYMEQQIRPSQELDPALVERRVVFLRSFLDMAAQYGHRSDLFYRKVDEFFSLSEGESVQWIFEDILNMRARGIVDYLRRRYPQLTDREVATYCMVVCDMSKSAICLVLDISVKTYYNLRNILRGKLDLTNNATTFADHFEQLKREMEAEKGEA